jgi:3-(3-hydroxy-phenyl)propionate hydroxylase
LSAGIKDLNNLFWKMNWVVKEQLDPYILCTFAQERQTDIERLMGLNDWAQSFVASPIWGLFRYLLPLLPKAWLARKTDTTQEVTDGVISDIASGIGKMMPLPEVVNSKGKAVGLNQLLGQNFTVLCLGEDPIDLLSPKSLTYLNDLGCTFIKVTAKEDTFSTDGRFTQKIWDKQGKLERWLKKHRAKIAIIRPDRIVFDLSSTATEVNSSVAILRHYTGAVLKPLVQLDKQDS